MQCDKKKESNKRMESTMSLTKSAKLVLLLIVGSFVSPSVQAQSFTTLFSFNSVNGAFPAAGVIRDSAGNFYGTTEFAGGAGSGNVFKLDATGMNETVLSPLSVISNDWNPQATVIL